MNPFLIVSAVIVYFYIVGKMFVYFERWGRHDLIGMGPIYIVAIIPIALFWPVTIVFGLGMHAVHYLRWGTYE